MYLRTRFAAGLALIASTLPAQFSEACSPYPDNCLYTPAAVRNFTSLTTSVTYRDAAGIDRTVPFRVRIPAGLDGPLPVVIWSHPGLPPGNEFRLYVNDTDFGPEAFGDGLGDCETPVAKCNAFRALLTSTVLSFLDAYLLQSPEAIDYLRNSYVQRAGRAVVEWTRK